MPDSVLLNITCKKEKDVQPLMKLLKEARFNARESRSVFQDIEVDIPFEKAGEKIEAMKLLFRTVKVLEVQYDDGQNVIIMNKMHSFSLKDYLNAAEAGKLPPSG